MGVSIRRLGPGDEGVLAWLAALADEFDLPGASEPEAPLGPDAAAAYLADAAVLHWVAEADGGVVGELLCHVLPLPSGAGREVLLYSIGVHQRHRRAGIGRALLDELLRWARGAGIPDVWVLADNPGAEAFYAACGFERGGERDQGVVYLLDTSD
ncbi:MAG: GNAT family N-acetyltransferase [Thermoleophilia bacterium]